MKILQYIFFLPLKDRLIKKYKIWKKIDNWMLKWLGENHGAEDLFFIPAVTIFIISIISILNIIFK